MSKKPTQLDIVDAIDRLDKRGREIPDPTPMAPPVGFIHQPSMIENIRNMVRSENLRQQAMAQGLETMEEADDFDIGDDFDPSSPHEHNFDPPLPPPAAAEPPKAASEATAAEGGGSPNNPPPDARL